MTGRDARRSAGSGIRPVVFGLVLVLMGATSVALNLVGISLFGRPVGLGFFANAALGAGLVFGGFAHLASAADRNRVEGSTAGIAYCLLAAFAGLCAAEAYASGARAIAVVFCAGTVVALALAWLVAREAWQRDRREGADG